MGMISKTEKLKKALAHLGFKQLQFLTTLCGTANIEWLNETELLKAIKKTANMQPGQKNYSKCMAARITLHGQRAIELSTI